MLFRKFTFWFPFVAVVICLLNFFGIDRDNALLMSVSIPAWIYEMVYDVHTVHLAWLYSSTIIFWLVFGFFLDRAVARAQKTAKQKGEGS